jgi:hypothetical protein
MSDELVQFLGLRNICLPAKVYLAIVVVNFLSLFFLKKSNRALTIIIIAFVLMVFIGLAVTWFGNYLCKQGYEVVTWLLVIFPLSVLIGNLRKII